MAEDHAISILSKRFRKPFVSYHAHPATAHRLPDNFICMAKGSQINMYDTPPIPGGQVREGDWRLEVDNTFKLQFLDLLVQRLHVEFVLGTRGTSHHDDPKGLAPTT
jgi:hypothetical protein